MALRRRIGEVRIAAEATLRDRVDEAPLQLRAGMRLCQRQRGENAQADGGVGHRAGKQRIGHVIGLAEPERQRQHDLLADARDDRVGEAVGGIEWRRRGFRNCHAGWFTPACSSPRRAEKRSP